MGERVYSWGLLFNGRFFFTTLIMGKGPLPLCSAFGFCTTSFLGLPTLIFDVRGCGLLGDQKHARNRDYLGQTQMIIIIIIIIIMTVIRT